MPMNTINVCSWKAWHLAAMHPNLTNPFAFALVC